MDDDLTDEEMDDLVESLKGREPWLYVYVLKLLKALKEDGMISGSGSTVITEKGERELLAAQIRFQHLPPSDEELMKTYCMVVVGDLPDDMPLDSMVLSPEGFVGLVRDLQKRKVI